MLAQANGSQTYEGYFENGNFYAGGEVVRLPEHEIIFITVPDGLMENKREMILKRGRDALREAQIQAKVNGTSEMTLDEINELISEVRCEREDA